MNESIRGGQAPDSYRPPGWQPVFERVLKMILESRGGKVPPEEAAEVTRLADTFALHILANWPRYGTGWV